MAYLYKLKLQMQVNLTYRFEVFAGILTRFILVVANIFLWKCVYAGQGDIEGLGQNQMITYSVLSACLSVMFSCNVQNTMNNDVRNGNIAVLLMKPYNLICAYFAEDIGTILVKTLNVAVPVLFLCMIIFPVSGPASLMVLPLVLVSYILGLLILWLLSALVGMFTFVTMELGNMGVVKDTIVIILSGSMIPIWFFPEAAESFLMKTPFPYTYQTPLGLYIGRIGIQEGIQQISIQIFWVFLFGMATVYTWRKVQDKVMIQGG